MIRRIGVLASAISMLSVYAGLIWIGYDHFFPPHYSYNSEWYDVALTSRGEILYRKSNSNDLYLPDGTPLPPARRDAALNDLLQDVLSNQSIRGDEWLYGYRWRAAISVELAPGVYSWPSSDSSEIVIPLLDERTYGIYTWDGDLRGRLTPEGFITGREAVRGFNPNAYTSDLGERKDSFYVTDTTGLYRLSSAPPSVARLFEAPPATYSAEVISPARTYGNPSIMEAVKFISDTALYIGRPGEIGGIALPPNLIRREDGSRYFNIKASPDYETIALVNYVNDSRYLHLVARRNGAVLLDTTIPPFTGRVIRHDLIDYWKRYRREVFEAAIQPMPIPGIVCMVYIARLKYGAEAYNFPPDALRHYTPPAIALLVMHLAGALAGFLLARAADPRPRVTIFWALIGFFVSVPVILVYPFHAPTRGAIPCRACGRKLRDPENCPYCGAPQTAPPLIG